MKCPKCGSRLWKKEDNCPKCGEPLESTAEEPKKTGIALRLKKDDNESAKDKSDKPDKSEKTADKSVGNKKDKSDNTRSAKDKDRDKKDGREKSDKPEKPEKVRRGLFAGKAPDESGDKPEKEKKVPAERTISLKMILIAAAALLVIVLILWIVLSFRSSQGERYAEAAYEYIGRNIRDLNDGMTGKLFYADSSQYAGVNNAVKFDYIAESEGTVRAGGVKYPKWAVTIRNDKTGGHISDVCYTDFSVVKGDMRGIKTKGLINLDRFSEGEKKSSVLREISPRPYSISCSQTGIILYTYKYWYKLDNGDEQAAILRVGFSEKGDFKYAATEILIPPNM